MIEVYGTVMVILEASNRTAGYCTLHYIRKLFIVAQAGVTPRTTMATQLSNNVWVRLPK